MPVDVLLGLQWGDEGKGKIVDTLAPAYQYVARFQGGPNAGHTIYVEGRKFVLHHIPSGIFHPHALCVIGAGVIINPITLRDELLQLMAAGVPEVARRLLFSDKAHLILPTHPLLDEAGERRRGAAAIGSTLRGISPTYRDKVMRRGLRVGDLLLPDFPEKARALMALHAEELPETHDLPAMLESFLDACAYLRSFVITATELVLHKALAEGASVLAEGAQGAMLDLDFGSYPYVTSSSTTAGGACVGLGVPPRAVRHVIGVVKAYATRVGNGPFPTELAGETAERLREAGQEYGATTGRPRRCGWLDLPALRYAVALNGVTHLAVTKVDVLQQLPEVCLCTEYRRHAAPVAFTPDFSPESQADLTLERFAPWKMAEEGDYLPDELTDYLRRVAELAGAPVAYVSSGVGRRDVFALADLEV